MDGRRLEGDGAVIDSLEADLQKYPSVSHLGDCSMTISSGRLTEGDWSSDYQLLLGHPVSPSEPNTPAAARASTFSSSSPRLQPSKLRLLGTPTKASEHVNLITMMARLTTEEESNQVAVLMKELQYLKEEASDLRSATSRLNAEADILRKRLGHSAALTE